LLRGSLCLFIRSLWGRELFRAAVVLGAALVDLPVHAERLIVEDLKPVHPDVALTTHGVAREHAGQRDEASRVTGPASEHREAGDRGMLSLDDLLTWRRSDVTRRRLHDVQQRAELSPALGEGPGQREIEQLGDPFAQIVEPVHAQGPRHPFGRPERVDEDWHVRALDALEE